MKRAMQIMLGACVLMGTALAQVTDYGAVPSSSRNDSNTHDSGMSQKFCRSKDLVGANIKDSAGQKLGSIDELYINPQNGETFASVSISGGKYALVPVQAFSVSRPGGALRNAELALNTTKDAFQSAPALAKNEWQRLDDPSFTRDIYTHFKLQPPAAVGGTETGSLGGRSTGASGSTTKPDQSKHY